MAVQQEQHTCCSFPSDNLYCEEERWEEVDGENRIWGTQVNDEKNPIAFPPLFLLEQDLLWEDEELLTLFTKEKQQAHHLAHKNTGSDSSSSSLASLARVEAVEWMIKVNSHYGFSTLSAILAINYFDRFSSAAHFQKDKPWMAQLVAVACLSLGAKMEETQVPLLLALQVEETPHVFEAKTIQKMELLVLSTLQWKMNPVTPLSFLDHIMRRLGLKSHLHWEFLRRSELLLLSIAADPKYVSFFPSVLATATMMRVIEQVEPCNPILYQNQLMGVLKISKEEVNECYEQLIVEPSSETCTSSRRRVNKRKLCCDTQSPDEGIDARCVSGISSNTLRASSLGSSMVSSSAPEEPPLKKRSRAHEQNMPFSSLNPVSMDLLSSPN